jgi:hypothetical protein
LCCLIVCEVKLGPSLLESCDDLNQLLVLSVKRVIFKDQ